MRVENYNQNPTWLELLITNICIFMIINQIQLIVNTWIFGCFIIGKGSCGVSLQNRLRMDEMEGKHPRIWKMINSVTNLIGFVLVIVAEVMIFGYYDIQLTKPLAFRIFVLAVFIVIGMILFFIGKKRYTPRYI